MFTESALAGNQLAVFPDASEIADELLQPLAREMNFSETTFCYPQRPAGLPIRIFTPTVELPFAGHPVLGTAAVMAGSESAVTLLTKQGPIPVDIQEAGPLAWTGRMRQPNPSVAAFEAEAELLAALGVGHSVLPVTLYDNGARHVFVALPTPDEVAALAPNQDAVLRAAPGSGVNCFAGHQDRWKTRMFGPGVGVPEDPATGSAAGPLALHLCRHGLVEFGQEIEITQGVEIGRPSTLRAVVDRDGQDGLDIRVGGSVIEVARGTIRLRDSVTE